MLPLLVLCTLCPVYMSSAFKHLVRRAQALLQVIGFSAYCLVPTPNGLVMWLVMGWLAAVWWCTADWSHVEKHITSADMVILQCPRFLFFVVAGDVALPLLVASLLVLGMALHSHKLAAQCCPASVPLR